MTNPRDPAPEPEPEPIEPLEPIPEPGEPEPPAEPDEGEEAPNDSWLKADIQTYLDTHDIEYPSTATKASLLKLVP